MLKRKSYANHISRLLVETPLHSGIAQAAGAFIAVTGIELRTKKGACRALLDIAALDVSRKYKGAYNLLTKLKTDNTFLFEYAHYIAPSLFLSYVKNNVTYRPETPIGLLYKYSDYFDFRHNLFDIRKTFVAYAEELTPGLRQEKPEIIAKSLNSIDKRCILSAFAYCFLLVARDFGINRALSVAWDKGYL